MIRRLAPGDHEYDLCIIGAGPMGLTIAAEFAFSGLRVCVLESGEEKRSAFADALKHVRSEGLAIKPESRERLVGGASLTWSSRSARMDAVDLEPRPWSEGWPISREELARFEERAGAYRFPALGEFERPPAEEGDPGSWQNLQEKVFVATLPTYRFASLNYLFDRPGLDLSLGSTVVRLEHAEGRVTGAACRTQDGAEIRIRARAFVLGAGGIENPRLLLNSGIGNEHDQVGRFFMNHTKSHRGHWRLARRLPARSLFVPRKEGSRVVYVGLRLSEEFQRAHGLLNSYVGMDANRGTIQRYACALGRRILPGDSKLLAEMSRPGDLKMCWHVDMEPRADNRVMLGQERDAFGMPMPLVRHSLSDRDRETIRALWSQLEANVARLGLGKLRGSAEDVVAGAEVDASHHLGATRMGRDPRTSVVNPECRVHSVENLYLAGGSVFPTASCANPTFTMVALAIRLASHLQRVLAVPDAPPAAPPAGKRIVVIGAGRRVGEDVVPALESLAGQFEIAGVFARATGAVFGRRRRYDVRPLQEADAALRTADFVYLAVPRGAVTKALRSLPPLPQAELIIDTPAPVSREARELVSRFRKVHVAEDCAWLPWLDAVRGAYAAKGASGPAGIDCDRSVYRYHGIALLKALAGPAGSPARVTFGRRWGRTLRLKIGKARARIVLERDYAKGKLSLDGKEVLLRQQDGRCTGFEFDGVSSALSAEESLLLGGVNPADTVVSRMLALKRVGLARMLTAIAQGKDPWPFEEGVDDARVDYLVHRYRLYFPLGAPKKRG